jgi:hypothetical protein
MNTLDTGAKNFQQPFDEQPEKERFSKLSAAGAKRSVASRSS